MNYLHSKSALLVKWYKGEVGHSKSNPFLGQTIRAHKITLLQYISSSDLLLLQSKTINTYKSRKFSLETGTMFNLIDSTGGLQTTLNNKFKHRLLISGVWSPTLL